ncbi:protein 2 3 complex subunit [Chytridiales sp. JEL 0842]|nr:protein 2 3 complex subunit [Chytridiales sp. JEL 0842]
MDKDQLAGYVAGLEKQLAQIKEILGGADLDKVIAASKQAGTSGDDDDSDNKSAMKTELEELRKEKYEDHVSFIDLGCSNVSIASKFGCDGSVLAISPANNEVHIYKQGPTGWSVVHVLNEHDKLVTSIDWAPETNKIVTCAQDRNAYVWTFENGTWKPQLVLLRINRAATFVRWSPREDKFAVATGSRLIAIAYFETDNDWYVTKHIRRPIRSTVLSLDWHPENILIAAGSSDNKARVFSAYIKGVDQKAANPVWGERLPFGTVCGEFGNDNGGWVHSVAFSPSGNTLAWTAHDGNVSFASGPNSQIMTAVTTGLPLMSLIFISENSVVAAGHDCVPYLFSERGGQWQLVDKLDKGKAKVETGNSAMNKFRQMDSRGQSTTDTELNSMHQNTITSIRSYEGSMNNVRKFSTSGVDGKLIIWKL